MGLIEILSPAQGGHHDESGLTPRSGILDHRRLGLLGNGKTNARLLLDMVEAALRENGIRTEVVRVDKEHSGVPVDLATLNGCDAVVTAVGD